ncbi:MAG: glutathione peroxidase [Methylococcaceae bacterium]|nr:glutathione peroxidase [Methylococcaceae bacterium]
MNTTVFDFHSYYHDGQLLNLADFAGQVLLIVNTASRCGFTPQYAGLERLYRHFRDRGFAVIAFPCNQFGRQEPGTSEEAANYCRQHYEVSFPVSEIIDIKGYKQHPLFAFLTQSRRGVLGTQGVKWNFTKFLVDRKGHVAHRYGSLVAPQALAKAIDSLLAEKPVLHPDHADKPALLHGTANLSP